MDEKLRFELDLLLTRYDQRRAEWLDKIDGKIDTLNRRVNQLSKDLREVLELMKEE